MNKLLEKTLGFMQTRIGGLMIFICAAIATFLHVSHIWDPALAVARPMDIRTSMLLDESKIEMKAVLSQDTVLVGRSSPVSMELSIKTPRDDSRRNSSGDFLVVLDRSGSMQAERRMSYAKTAIKKMLDVLHEGDRFGLITFDSEAAVVVPLTSLTADKRHHISRLVDSIQPGGSTNLSDGISLAHRLMKSEKRQAGTTILVLSDGEANLGIQHPEGLNLLAKGVANSEMVLSTIGMGLDFNERIMTGLADFGMGTFDYLETLECLGDVLGRAVNSSRRVYAQASYIEFPEMSGATVLQAGGYPIERLENGGVIIPIGQLTEGSTKNVMVQVRLDTSRERSLEMAGAVLNYVSNGRRYRLGADRNPLLVHVVNSSKADQVRASVNLPLMKRNYNYDKFGYMQRKFSEAISRGNEEAARAALSEYDKDSAEAQASYGEVFVSQENERELAAMKGAMKEAFAAGPQPRQREQQNRLGKKYWKEALSNQRQSN